MKSKVKVIRELGEKQVENLREVSQQSQSSSEFNSVRAEVSTQFSGNVERVVDAPRAVSGRNSVSERELEHQSTNFYTSGLAAAEERRHYVSQAPRIVSNQRVRFAPRSVSEDLQVSANSLAGDLARNSPSDLSDRKYYEVGASERKKRVDQ